MKKTTIILICMMMIMAGYALAETNHSYSDTHVYIADDFDSFNSSFWGEDDAGNDVSVTGGYLYFNNGNGEPDSIMGIYALSPNYEITPYDEFNITYIGQIPVGQDGAWAKFGFMMTNSTSGEITTGATGGYMIVNAGNQNGLNNGRYTVARRIDGSYLNMYNSSSGGSAGEGIPQSSVKFEVRKYNNPDRTFYVEYYREGILMYNASNSNMDMSIFDSMYKDNFTMALFQGDNTNERLYIDYFEISVKKGERSEFPPGFTLTDDGWNIYDDFTFTADDIYAITSPVQVSEANSQLRCFGSGGNLIINHTNFTVNPLGTLIFEVEYATSNSNSVNPFIVQNFTDTSSYSNDADKSYSSIWVRNRAVSSDGSLVNRNWNGVSSSNSVDDWSSSNGWGMTGTWIYNRTVLPNGSVYMSYRKNGVLEKETTQVPNANTFWGNEIDDDWVVSWFCRSAGAANTYIDSWNITYTEPTDAPNTAPVIVVSNPANETETNTPDDIVFTATDDYNATVSCSLYVDASLNQTNASVQNATSTTFPMTWDEGMHTFYLTCTDADNLTTTTGTYSYYLDTTDPNVNSVTPNIFNSTVFDSYTMNILGNATNTELINVTRTIKYPNGTVFNLNETTTFGDPTLHTWDETYNTTLEPNGLWTMTIYALDNVLNSVTREYSFEVDNCLPDWVCSGYTACNQSDLASCNAVTDNNACGLPFGAKGEQLSDFADQPCNFCSADLTLEGYGTCNVALGFRMDNFTDNNYASCCQVTALPSDCPTGNVSSGLVNVSCNSLYISQYGADDVQGVATDFLVRLGIALIGFAGIVAVILVGKFAINRVRRK